MNVLIVLAGVVGALTTVGHFVVGSRRFLAPMLAAPIEDVPRKVMHCVFHYISTYLVLSTAALLLVGFGACVGEGTTALVQFIAINYLVFALWQLLIAFGSGIPRAPLKLFQWVFFLLIAVLSWLGV